jgi:putative transposase
MARPLRIHAPGVLCHVMSRGNDKQHIFLGDADFTHFLELLASLLERFDVQCVAYCLMWNHTHLLLRPAQQPLSRLMQHLNSAHCQNFNRRHGRVGHLLQGRFKSLWVEDDIYFLRVLRYIVRNPVAAGYVNDPAAWTWSSYRATAGLEPAPPCLDVQAVWNMFDHTHIATAAEQFRIFAGAEIDDPAPRRTLLAGSQSFAASLDPQLQRHREDEDFSYAERFATRPPLDQLIPAAAVGAAVHEAVRTAFLTHAYTLREIGEHLGRPSSTIWSWIHRAQREASSKEASSKEPSFKEVLVTDGL